MRKIIIFTFLTIVLASCVPTKRLTYLQDKNEDAEQIALPIRRVQPPYRFQVNDIVFIDVIIPVAPQLEKLFRLQSAEGNLSGGPQSYFNGYTIDIHGDIKMPKLGKIKAIGLTVKELEDAIGDKLKGFIREESDFFIRVKLDGLTYTLTGEVTSPGQKQVYDNEVSVIDAIADAGGIPITGDLTDVRVLRRTPTGIKRLNFDLTDESILASPDLLVQRNDIIVVNPLPQKSLGLGTDGFGTVTTIIGIATGLFALVLILNNTSN